MFGVKDREYLFWRGVGLTVGFHGGQPAENAGLDGGLEFEGSMVNKHKIGSDPIYLFLPKPH